MKKMKITLHKDGTQKIEVLNAVGEACVEFTREMEERLGAPAGERQFKPECFEKVIESESEREVER